MRFPADLRGSRTSVRLFGRTVPGHVILIGLLLAAGLVLRLAWAAVRTDSGAFGEAFNVAQALAEGRGFADAYGPGHGPTAHLLPTMPLLAGGVYALFGVRSATSEIILITVALTLVFGSYLLFYKAFEHLGVPRWARLASLGYLCVAPAYIAPEVVDFRVWEGGLAVALLALFLHRLLAAETMTGVTWPAILTLALVLSLLFFVNPPLGLGAGVCALVFAARRLTVMQTALGAGLSAVFLLSLVTPWALRNQAQLGHPVLLRSNAGLELALAQHPRAWSDDDRGDVFKDRLGEIHPAQNGEALARMHAAGGEVEYSRALGKEASAWMQDNKGAVAGLMLIRARQVIAPEPWLYTTFGSGLLPGLRAALASIVGIAGVLSIVLALARGQGRWIYPLVIVLIPLLALSLFQPVPRYTYLFYGILTFASGYLIASVFDALGQHRRPPGRAARRG